MPVEFVNITPLNPLISSCDIKILYHGKNRNRSYISKPVANHMANSLPNVPIVGEFLVHKDDFGDHAEEMVINKEGVKFIKRTVPYGVVPSDTKVWWKHFQDQDGVTREYLMCQGYLWTGRYPEATKIIEEGKGQSMELDPHSLSGEWATPQNETSEYFIINEAIISALCILGDDVEPCFQGANITASNTLYSLDKSEFSTEMAQFMLDLKDALNSKEGGETMVEDNKPEVVETEVESTEEVATTEDFTEESGQEVETEVVEDSTTVEDTETEEEVVVEETPEDEEAQEPTYNLDEVVEYIELKTKFDALQANYDALVAELEGLKPELHSLREMKAAIDKREKESMIAKFYMLDESDLAEVREKIDSYTVEEIESKLAVIAVRKKVNFNLETENETDTRVEDPIISFGTEVVDNTPAWLKAVDAIKTKK